MRKYWLHVWVGMAAVLCAYSVAVADMSTRMEQVAILAWVLVMAPLVTPTHEMGHWLTARLCRLPVLRVKMFGLSGYVDVDVTAATKSQVRVILVSGLVCEVVPLLGWALGAPQAAVLVVAIAAFFASYSDARRLFAMGPLGDP